MASNLNETIMLDPTDVPGAVLPKEPSLCNVIELKRFSKCLTSNIRYILKSTSYLWTAAYTNPKKHVTTLSEV